MVQRNTSTCTWLPMNYSHFPKRPSGSWHPGTGGVTKGRSFPWTCCCPTGLVGILCHSQSRLLAWLSSKTIESHEVSSLLLEVPRQPHSFSLTYTIKVWPHLLCALRLRKCEVSWTPSPTAASSPQAAAHHPAGQAGWLCWRWQTKWATAFSRLLQVCTSTAVQLL